MGMHRDYLCPACGLKGHVSGGDDCGMVTETTTIYCETCKTLQDAVVKDWLAKNEPETEPRCRRRKAHVVKRWTKEEPCPRCGKALLQEVAGGKVMMWD
jgi:predicted RNA-binding Zn-ribbon protein involved in translation (DUF1610 family)